MSDITYTRVGDYLLPNIILQNSPDCKSEIQPPGRFARMRRAFLKEHKPILYNQLLLSEKLYPHLWEIDEAARNRLRVMGAEYRREAEEIILAELVYD